MKKILIVFLAGFLSLIVLNPVFAARTSYGMPGIYNLTPFTLLDGEGSGLSTDNHGQIILSPSSTVSLSASSSISAVVSTTSTLSVTPNYPVASTTLTYLFPNTTSTVNIKATAGDFTGMFFDNFASTKLYILFIDTTTTPVSGATPLLSYSITNGNQMILDAANFRYLQKYFSNGIGLCLSTTFKTCTR
jgi:hypothetical protein